MFAHLSTGSSADGPPAAAVIVAGGAGRRMGGPVRKQYLEVGGEPVLLRAVRPFLLHPRIREVAVVLPRDDVSSPPQWLADLGVRLVPGGAERGDSVRNGLEALASAAVLVLIHDGARPFVPAEVIDRVLRESEAGGAIAAIPVTDTVKEVRGDGLVVGTPDRSRLWAAQTPQGFPLQSILRAYRRAGEEGVAATDDAALYERYIGPVRVVPGSPHNLKVTRPEDLVVAEAIAADGNVRRAP